MTVLRYKNRIEGEPAFNNLLSDLFPQMPSLYRNQPKNSVPVNIRETEKEYLLDVVAPGLKKGDFKISLDNKILTISVSVEEQIDNTNFIRNEYSFSSFERSFTVDEKIAADAISAQYVNGVLTLNLPKKADVKPATKQITIQ